MQAESVLVQNLFSAFLVLALLDLVFPLALIRCCGKTCTILIFVLLGVAIVHRVAAYVIRENRLYNIYVRTASNPAPVPAQPAQVQASLTIDSHSR